MTINKPVSPKKPLFAEVHNVPDDYRFTTEELDRIISGDMFTPRQDAIMARELQQYRAAAEPVAWQWFHLNQWHVTNDEERARELAWDGVKVVPLYRHAAPQVTSVPPFELFWSEFKHPFAEDDELKSFASEIWNACCAAAPAVQAEQLSGNTEPVSQPYRLRDAVTAIRNSGIAIDAGNIQAERDALNEPTCWCHTCRPVALTDMRFVVCPECGNKRCPHANDHKNACTGRNEPGQEGSAYPAAPQQEAE